MTTTTVVTHLKAVIQLWDIEEEAAVQQFELTKAALDAACLRLAKARLDAVTQRRQQIREKLKRI